MTQTIHLSSETKLARIDYTGKGAGTICSSDGAFSRRFRAFQRQLSAAGVALEGANSFVFKLEDEGRVFYAVPRVAVD